MQPSAVRSWSVERLSASPSTADEPATITSWARLEQHADDHETAWPVGSQSRRSFLRTATAVALMTTAAATIDVDTAHATTATQPLFLTPFTQFETVDQVPKAYFDEHRSLYAYVERIIDGDTVRVRHIPAYRFRLWSPSPLQQRGIANDTLIVRIYGVDCPELAKNGNKGQAFAQEAKQFTSDLLYHRMVKITFLRKDQYRRAVAVVETLGRGGPLLSWIPGLRPRDVSVELAAAGLAELYTGGGAEYNVSRVTLCRVGHYFTQHSISHCLFVTEQARFARAQDCRRPTSQAWHLVAGSPTRECGRVQEKWCASGPTDPVSATGFQASRQHGQLCIQAKQGARCQGTR